MIELIRNRLMSTIEHTMESKQPEHPDQPDHSEQPVNPEHVEHSVDQTVEQPIQKDDEKSGEFIIERLDNKPNNDHSTISGTVIESKDQTIPFEIEKAGEIIKEEEILKDAKKKLQTMIREIKGIEISDKNIDEIIEQVDKSCIEEIIATQMRVEWERIFVNHYDELYTKLKDFNDLIIDLENSKIIILDDKSSDYDIKLKDHDIEECLKKYNNRVVGRGLHARVIVELLILSDIHQNLINGISLEETLKKFDQKEMDQIAINLGENSTDLGYREGIAYAFLIILESHNIGIKEIEEGKNETDKKAVEKKYR